MGVWQFHYRDGVKWACRKSGAGQFQIHNGMRAEVRTKDGNVHKGKIFGIGKQGFELYAGERYGFIPYAEVIDIEKQP